MNARPLKLRLFRIAALALVVAAVLVVVELGFRIREARRIGVQQIDHGLLSYHEQLGWRLTPGWHGRHRYAGFDVTYSIDSNGFRRSPELLTPSERRSTVLVVGDSFTFGIGVAENETFVARLNEGSRDGPIYVNCGVPGFSTDQEVLLAEQELERRPRVSGLILAVCLANDLLDNPRAYPMQTHLGKPVFVQDGGKLVLTNTPVPRLPKLPSNSADELAAAIHGPSWSPNWMTWLARRSAFAKVVQQDVFELRGEPFELLESHRQHLALFWALVDRLRQGLQHKGGFLKLLLLPGNSGVLFPESSPGQYQQRIRDELVAEAKAHNVTVIDLLAEFRSDKNARRRDLNPLFLSDGHLSALGNRAAAGAIRKAIDRQEAVSKVLE